MSLYSLSDQIIDSLRIRQSFQFGQSSATYAYARTHARARARFNSILLIVPSSLRRWCIFIDNYALAQFRFEIYFIISLFQQLSLNRRLLRNTQFFFRNLILEPLKRDPFIFFPVPFSPVIIRSLCKNQQILYRRKSID